MYFTTERAMYICGNSGSVVLFAKKNAHAMGRDTKEVPCGMRAGKSQIGNGSFAGVKILRETVPEECIENVAKAEELLKQIQYKSYEDGCANQKQCAFCGANNAISAYRCEVCGAPFMQ